MQRRPHPPSSRGRLALTGRGFTTVELVVVIVLLAVLAAAAIPRLSGRTGFESRAFGDEVAAAVRYAQRSAIAMRRTVTVSTATVPGSACVLRLCLTPDCSQQVTDPATGSPFCLVAPAAVTLASTGGSPAGVQFDATGRPAAAHAYTLSSTAPGVEARTITVEAETGHVR